MQLYIIPSSKEEGAAPTLIDDLHKTFKEWGIKEDGVNIQLREPGKKGTSYAWVVTTSNKFYISIWECIYVYFAHAFIISKKLFQIY